jgi:hypothetical protein
MITPRTLAAIAAGLIAIAATAAFSADQITVLTSNDSMLKLRPVAFEGGRTLELTVGIGSGAFRHPDAPRDIIQTVSDRGPNFTCKDGVKITGLSQQKLCGKTKGARIYPVPEYAPTIYTVKIGTDGRFRVIEALPLKDRDGKPLNGLLNPLTKAKTEIPFDRKGRRLAQDPSAVDAEALVKLKDGSYWIADESAPSIIHVGPDGRVIKRLVPAGTEGDFKGANYTVEGKLPAILYKRHTNRGIESIAISPDERFLYFAMQSPLDNPDAAAYRKGRNIRLFKFDRGAEKTVGEYVYVMDAPGTFTLDNVKKARKQNDVKISEMSGLGLDRLLVLERISKTTKLYEIDLARATNILGGKWDDAATKPSLEQTAAAVAGIKTTPKSLFFSTDDHKGLPDKIEGIAHLGDGSLALINDDDFGIEGARTKIIVIRRAGDKATAKR